MPTIRRQLINTSAALLFMLTAVTPILGWSQTETMTCLVFSSQHHLETLAPLF